MVANSLNSFKIRFARFTFWKPILYPQEKQKLMYASDINEQPLKSLSYISITQIVLFIYIYYIYTYTYIYIRIHTYIYTYIIKSKNFLL